MMRAQPGGRSVALMLHAWSFACLDAFDRLVSRQVGSRPEARSTQQEGYLMGPYTDQDHGSYTGYTPTRS